MCARICVGGLNVWGECILYLGYYNKYSKYCYAIFYQIFNNLNIIN